MSDTTSGTTPAPSAPAGSHPPDPAAATVQPAAASIRAAVT